MPNDSFTGSAADPSDLRAAGWTVAVHNDYRLNNQFHTFWIFTKDNLCYKGEGLSDAEALDQIRKQVGLPVQQFIPLDDATKLQMAGVLLQTGSEQQKIDAVGYISSLPPRF